MNKSVGVYADDSSFVCLDGAIISGFDVAVEATDSIVLMRGGHISYNDRGIVLRRSQGSEVRGVNLSHTPPQAPRHTLIALALWEIFYTS